MDENKLAELMGLSQELRDRAEVFHKRSPILFHSVFGMGLTEYMDRLDNLHSYCKEQIDTLLEARQNARG